VSIVMVRVRTRGVMPEHSLCVIRKAGQRMVVKAPRDSSAWNFRPTKSLSPMLFEEGTGDQRSLRAVWL
ncbi:MAG TPA: hypothetical protein VIJ85_13025, partial [Rhizomicrobium sp.]